MKSLLLSIASSISILGSALARTDASYTTQGEVTVPPQIDALVWTNRDTVRLPTISIEPSLQFETQNTERFVNLGVIEISPGIRFETVRETGERIAAHEFINRGEISSPGFFYLSGEFDDPIHRVFGGRISIWADAVTSPGYITGLHAGLIEIRGKDVNLTRGGVGNDTISASVFFRDPQNLVYNPEIGFQDEYWRYATLDVGFGMIGGDTEELVIQSPFDPTQTFTNIAVPFNGVGGFDITTVGGDIQGGGFVGGGPNPFQTFVRKQTLDTNVQVFDIVFVRVSDPQNVLVNVSWGGRAPQSSPPFGIAFVTLSSVETNVVRGQPALNAVTFIDSFATRPAEALFQNLLTENTYQPTNMFAIRGAFPGGDSTNYPFFSSGDTNTLTHWIDSDPAFPLTFTNYTPMTNTPLEGVGYCTWAGSIAWQPSIPLSEDPTRASLTNIAGRVSIDAENLILSRTRIQGQGGVTIKAKNLIAADRLVVDAPILSLDLNTAKNDLIVAGIASGSAKRMGGEFAMFSTVISNTFTFTFTNAPADPTQAGTTEDVNYVAFYHITVLDTDFTSLRTQLVEDIRLVSDKVTISDPMPVSRDLLIDAIELVVNNTLERVDDKDVNLTSAEFPRLDRLEVTTDGLLQTRGLLESGDSSRTLSKISNFGEMSGTGVRLRVGELDNSGLIGAEGGQLDIGAGKITGTAGDFWGAYGLSLQAGAVEISDAIIESGGDMLVNVESASFTGTELIVSTQLEVSRTPSVGSFGGLKISALPRRFEETVIVWPDTDVGPSSSGMSGSGFLGELSFGTGDLDPFNQDFNAVRLKGSSSANALYVGLLSFSDDALAVIEDYLLIDTNLTVYFSATSPNVAPEVLDGFVTSNGGKLVYAPASAGGSTIVVRAGVSSDGSSIELTWDGAPSAGYRIDSRGLNGGDWTSVGAVKNSTAKTTRLKLDDSIAAGPGKLYRVVRTN